MRFRQRGRLSFLIVIMCILLEALSTSFGTLASEEVVLYQEDCESGWAEDWQLEGNWGVIQDTDGNWVLSGQEHYWARYTGDAWGDYTFKLRLKLLKGTIHINYRASGCTRYFVGFGERSLYLNKTSPCDTHPQLRASSAHHSRGRWYQVEIVGKGGKLDIYVNGQRKISYVDSEPLLYGTIALETLEDSEVYVDDIMVLGHAPPTLGLEWVRTGGPLGGLGYDVRMRPDNTDTMYVTDAWAGVFMSTDGGQSWFPSNQGITTRLGMSGDAIPIFCLTIDPHDPDIIWTGTDGVRGIFKSTDGGRSWVKRDNGIVENFGITFRGFTVDPRTSDIVYCAAEIHSSVWAGEVRTGREFDMTQGVVYKTTDGGGHWKAIWRGDNLARYVWIDPRDPDVIYVSTGIFDREAANSVPNQRRAGGVGVVKSTDGGLTWTKAVNGLGNLYVGTLFMHPEDPDILLAGTGNNQYYAGNGVYLSTDGGDSWQKTLGRENITSVEYATADPAIAYAASADAVYRSHDGGHTWQKVSGGPNGWGPPGVRAGFPIDFQVDPRDPDRIFVNNYGGGNFLSTDGGRTWAVASNGYTGAQVRDITVDPSEANRVFAAARSGIFATTNGGEEWTGLSFPPAPCLEWYVVSIDPTDSQHVLAANNWDGFILESHDGGRQWWSRSFRPDESTSWRAVVFAPSDPKTVYAGSSAFYSAGTFDDRMPARGIYVSHDAGATWTVANNAVSRDANVTALAVSPEDQHVVYAATGNHGLLKSTDGGGSWTPINQGLPRSPVALSVAVHPVEADVVYAGLSRGGLYRSEDRGATWQSATAGMNPEASVSDIVFDPTNPHVMFAADRMSGVYRSSDAGATWIAINKGLRTRDVNALAISADGTTLYAATEGEGVFRLDLTALEESPGGTSLPSGDRDGDGVPDEEDYCPDYPGKPETNGC